MTSRTTSRSDWIWLGAILVGHALVWALHPYAHLDDLDSQHYARLAAELLAGEFEFAHHPFNDRLGITVPTAALYGLFGISGWTVSLWPLIASLATVAAVYSAARHSFGSTAARLSALLLATNPVQVEYAAHLLPDVVASAFLFVAMALYLGARETEAGGGRGRPATAGALGTLALFAGFMSKTTVVWAFPFLLALLVLDLVRGRNRRFWGAVLAMGVSCIGLFLFGYYLATGSPLHVLESIEGSHNVSVASFDGKDPSKIVHRLTRAPLQFLGRQLGYGCPTLLAVPALVHLVRRRAWLPSGLRVWTAYLLVVLFSFWFGSTSLEAYNPLPVSARFLMPLLAPLALIGGVTLARVVLPGGARPGGDASGSRAQLPSDSRAQARGGARLLALVFLAAAALVWPREARAGLYVALGLTFGWLALGGGAVRGPLAAAARYGLCLILTVGVLAYYGTRGEVKPPNPLRGLQTEFAGEHLADLPADAVVFTDDHTAFVLPLVLERLGRTPPLLVDWADTAAVRAHAGAPARAFVDQTALSMMNEWLARDIPTFAIEPPSHWRELARRDTRWRGGSNVSKKYFRVQSLLLFELDDPTELLGQ